MALDRLFVVFKVGDQETAADKEHYGLRHGDIVDYIDEEDWGVAIEDILSDNMRRVFIIVEVDRSYKNTFFGLSRYQRNSGRPINEQMSDDYKPRIGWLEISEFGNDIGYPDLEADALDPSTLVPIIDMRGQNPLTRINTGPHPLRSVRSVRDVNSVSSGSYTVGSGGNYATMAEAFADIGSPLSGNLTFTLTSDVTETASSACSADLNGNTFTITSDTDHEGDFDEGNIMTLNAGNGITWFNFTPTSTSGGAKIILSKINAKLITSTTSNSGLVQSPNNANVVIDMYSCIFNCGEYSLCGLRADGAAGIRTLHNCIFTGCKGTNVAGILLIASSASDTYENITFYNNTMGIWNYSNVAFTARNLASFNMADDCYSYGLAKSDGLGNATADKCASSDGTGSEAGLRSLTTTDQFQSLTISNADFLKPSEGGVLDNSGSTVSVTLNTQGIGGNVRPHSSVYSIGAHEYAASGPTLPLLTNFYRMMRGGA